MAGHKRRHFVADNNLDTMSPPAKRARISQGEASPNFERLSFPANQRMASGAHSDNGAPTAYGEQS